MATLLKSKNGNFSAVAAAFGVTTQAVWKYVHNHPELQQIAHDANEFVNDTAEDQLFEAIKRGEAWAICFRLKTRAKNRGYSERTELTGKDGGAIRGAIQTETELTNVGRALEEYDECIRQISRERYDAIASNGVGNSASSPGEPSQPPPLSRHGQNGQSEDCF